jgi:hypothetical protein
LADAGRCCRGVVFDHSNQQTVAFLEADRAAQRS